MKTTAQKAPDGNLDMSACVAVGWSCSSYEVKINLPSYTHMTAPTVETKAKLQCSTGLEDGYVGLCCCRMVLLKLYMRLHM